MILQSGVRFVFHSREILFSGSKFVGSWQAHEMKKCSNLVFFPFFAAGMLHGQDNGMSGAHLQLRVTCCVWDANGLRDGRSQDFWRPTNWNPIKVTPKNAISRNRMLNETRSGCRSVTKMYEHAMSSFITLLLWIFIESCHNNSVHHVPSSIRSVWLTKYFSTRVTLPAGVWLLSVEMLM